jgi:glycosyltransferase involved in cell wall biosynthesis
LNGIVVYNEFAKSRLTSLNSNIYIVPGGIDPELFKPIPKPESKSRNSVLMVGRTTARMKGFPVLHRACHMLWEEGLEFTLLCTGRGRIQHNGVENMGWLSQEELPKLYAQCDICVVPSIWPEPFGIVALEAMACGKPVIVSRVGGLQNIINDGVEGFIVDPGSPEQIRDKLALLLKEPELRKQMGEAGRKRVMADYTWDNICNKYYAPLFN